MTVKQLPALQQKLSISKKCMLRMRHTYLQHMRGVGEAWGWRWGGGRIAWSKIKYIFWHDKKNSMLEAV